MQPTHPLTPAMTYAINHHETQCGRHGIRHQGISIKPLSLILLSISDLSSSLYQPITVTPTKANPSSLGGLKR
jgi:hypothetical protein